MLHQSKGIATELAIDWAIVHALATRHLGDFEAFARAMSQDQV